MMTPPSKPHAAAKRRHDMGRTFTPEEEAVATGWLRCDGGRYLKARAA